MYYIPGTVWGFCLLFCFGHMAYGILVPQPVPSAVEAESETTGPPGIPCQSLFLSVYMW